VSKHLEGWATGALPSSGTSGALSRSLLTRKLEEDGMARGLLLWLLGVPIPVIILLWLFFSH
jgi:hypothetical protein